MEICKGTYTFSELQRLLFFTCLRLITPLNLTFKLLKFDVEIRQQLISTEFLYAGWIGWKMILFKEN